MSTLRFASVNADGLLADLDLPPAAYRALLKLRAMSEAGGRIHTDQATIGQELGLSRPSVNAALRTLELAKLVKKVRNGLYQINPMLAGYHSPRTPSPRCRRCPRTSAWTPGTSFSTIARRWPPTRTSSPRSAAARTTRSAGRSSKPSPERQPGRRPPRPGPTAVPAARRPARPRSARTRCAPSWAPASRQSTVASKSSASADSSGVLKTASTSSTRC